MITLQNDGNLVAYTSDNKGVWTSDTNGKDVSELQLSKRGYLNLMKNDRVQTSSFFGYNGVKTKERLFHCL